MCLRICTGFKRVSFRETHLWEHFGRTDKTALITCLKKLNVSGAFLRRRICKVWKWGNPKQHMKLQQPRNYDFWMLQFNLLGSQGGNSREMTTSPSGHYNWEVTVALTTAAKLQQVRANSREMTSKKLNEEHEILRRFMAVVVSSAFWGSLRKGWAWLPRFCGTVGVLQNLSLTT